MTTYTDRVEAALPPLPASAREAALDDLRAALAEGADEADLGSPEEYAAAVGRAFAPDPDKDEQGDVFGVPYETRGATDAAVRARLWDPADPRVVVPRMLGLGWTVNLGAVAVRLRLLRPDDWDADSLAAVPPRLMAALRYAPLAWAAVAVVVSLRTWRRGDPVPTRWQGLGRPDGWSSPSAALVPAALSMAAAAWGAVPTSGDDRMVRPAMAAGTASLGCTVAVLTARSAARPTRTVAAPALALVPAAAVVAQVAVPVWAALARVRPVRRGPLAQDDARP